MTMLRNLLTVVGVLAVIAFALLFWRGDDLYNQIFSKSKPPEGPVPNGKVYATLSASQANLVPDTSAPDGLAAVNLGELLEVQQTGFPPKNISYLAIINKEKNQIKYWKLSKNVRKVVVRTSP